MFYFPMLMIVTVNPVLPSTPIFSPTFYKELNQNYALFTRTKAALGKFCLNYLWGNIKLVLDTTIFTVDVFTDVANGVNLVRGPSKNSTSMIGNTSSLSSGRITKPHPIWGSQMIAIPFLPMLVHGFGLASIRYNPWKYLTLCGDFSKMPEPSMESNLVLCLLLAIPFTIIATP